MTICGPACRCASLLVWALLWELVGRLDLIMLIPPFTGVSPRGTCCPPATSTRRSASRCRRSRIGMAFSLVVGIASAC